ncbi:primase/helicase [Pseudomonas phage MiCath]|uniref:Primase/helicase n=1 Tax=Pseudomonas phage MiCath TaxID=3003729 RepID=A0AAE9VLK0_9CAUD|nr:primase/helicase [Pseudomonas phage MiCath]WAX22397.1 primase/helicase [Pseudomonas phage MiCath]
MTTMATAWGRLPAELKALPQWCLAGADKSPLSVDAKGNLYRASVVSPTTWLDFNTACREALERGLKIGFILSEEDPYSCIDLDVKDAQNSPDKPELWTTPEQFDLFYRILQTYDSYSEASQSGKGLHIWVRADIGAGCKRDGVELYSKERFIICTGNIVLDKPIRDANLMLNNMASQMRPKDAFAVVLYEVPEEEDDWSVLLKAHNATNREKFEGLWRGMWSTMGFPSQSEADMALMSMFTFYSPSNAQCRRLFRESQLGKREKAVKDDKYLNRTLALIRGREQRESAADISSLTMAADAMVKLAQQQQRQAAQAPAQYQQQPPATPRITPTLPTPLQSYVEPTPSPGSNTFSMLAPVPAEVAEQGNVGLGWPPGFLGRVAQFLYQNALRPIKEVAIASALGLAAGICAAWHIPKSGLNLYIVLVARSGIGKEALHEGIGNLEAFVPGMGEFINRKSIASGPALIKMVSEQKCFISLQSELGRRLKGMANDGRDNAASSLRTEYTTLYSKSGPGSKMGGIAYSNIENSTDDVQGSSFSVLGETTPGTFYECLTQEMMEDGFLSRWLIIESEADREKPNTNILNVPDRALIESLGLIVQHASTHMNNSMEVQKSQEAQKIIHDFEDYCDSHIRGNNDESQRQLYNRAALKAWRIAGLLAVFDNYLNPVMSADHVNWAIDIVLRNVEILRKRMDDGDVGEGDGTRAKKLISLVQAYFSKPIPVSYGLKDELRQNGIIPERYFHVRIQSIASFSKHRLGASMALKGAIADAISSGKLMVVDKDKVFEQFSYRGTCYRIVDV